MKIDLVIVNYRSERWLTRCVESLFVPEFEGSVWLIDNHELDDDLLRDLSARFPHLRYHKTGGNLGFGRANNVGIQEALESGAEIVGLVNPDTWFEKDWVGPLLEAFRSRPSLGIAAPLQLAYESDELADWTRGALSDVAPDSLAASGPPINVDWVEGSAMFVRRAVFEDVGGFDGLFDLYFEDNELCRRARLAGYDQAILPAVRYHHYGGGTLGGRANRQRRVRCDLGQLLYVLTNPERMFLQNVLSAVRLLVRRMIEWTRDRQVGFPFLLQGALAMTWEKKAGIWTKWRTDRRRFVR